MPDISQFFLPLSWILSVRQFSHEMCQQMCMVSIVTLLIMTGIRQMFLIWFTPLRYTVKLPVQINQYHKNSNQFCHPVMHIKVKYVNVM